MRDWIEGWIDAARLIASGLTPQQASRHLVIAEACAASYAVRGHCEARLYESGLAHGLAAAWGPHLYSCAAVLPGKLLPTPRLSYHR